MQQPNTDKQKLKAKMPVSQRQNDTIKYLKNAETLFYLFGRDK